MGLARVVLASIALTTCAVGAAGPSASAAGTSPSGQAMPPTAPTGWTRVFSDDFTTSVAQGGFTSSSYVARWRWYAAGTRDASGNGTNNPAIIAVSGGMLTERVRTDSGRAQVVAILPKLPGTANGRRYGRYTVRFRADAAATGYRVVWAQLPDSGVPNDGEIDFPDGDLDSSIDGFSHCANINHPTYNCLAYFSSTTFTGWHTATQEWKAGSVTLFLDGVRVATTTLHVPTAPMHWVLQTETQLTGGPPPASSHGRVQIDWVTVDVPST